MRFLIAAIAAVLLLTGVATAAVLMLPCGAKKSLPEPMAYSASMVQIDGIIDDESTAKWSKQILEAAASNQYVTIEINSRGGMTDAGFKLAKSIENCGKPTICIVDGFAHSYAFYILQSCTRRAMTKRSFLMAHETIYLKVETQYINKHGLMALSDDLDALDRSMSEFYAYRMGIPVEVIRRKWYSKNWYMQWEDALKYHAVDGVYQTVPEAVTKMVETMK